MGAPRTSGSRPRVARSAVPRTAALWLVADHALLRARVHAASHYDEASPVERFLADKFLARTARYQELMLQDVRERGLDHIDVGDRTTGELTDAVIARRLA